MPQSMNQGIPMTSGGEIRYPARLSDETGASLPPDRSFEDGDMIFGGPNLTYDMPPVSMNPGGQMVTAPSYPPAMNLPGEVVSIPGLNGSPVTRARSDSYEQGQRMKNPLDMEATHNPSDSRENYLASLRSLLARNVGYFVVATFLMGTSQHVTWQGILHTVGSDYLVLYQPDYERYISCDLYSLKFVQFS